VYLAIDHKHRANINYLKELKDGGGCWKAARLLTARLGAT
jgi:hypothetical protein